MSIRFDEERKMFCLETEHSKYAFQIAAGEYPVHIHYGRKEQELEDYSYQAMGFAPYFERNISNYRPTTCLSEYVGFDSGDYRSDSLRIKNQDGNAVTILTYQGYRIFDGREVLEGLPFAEADKKTQTLEIALRDEYTNVDVKLYYTVFPDEDIITRYVKITNQGQEAVTVEKCMSLLLDLPRKDFDMISLYGAQNYERNVQRQPLMFGMQSVGSRRGASSPQFNPFFALCDHDATQTEGEAYGFNFVFSGNFVDEVEVDYLEHTRVQVGLGGENFSWKLESGESFMSPEAVMTYSPEGLGQMTRNFHRFTRRHILPKEPFAQRPVVLNTWEACYFDIDEDVMEEFAKTAAESGIDMLVMDDGWFGARNDATAGLGDWYPNPQKFPNGLKPFIDKMKSYGLKFGIWVEPEMVNPDSDLYRTHPEWCIACPGREKMMGRTQWVLDMGNPEVLDYLKEMFTKTFDGIGIDYFKWDMNRHLSQVGSAYLPADRQGETAYRHMLGVYELLRWFGEQFPNAMIETCSGGGGRYDLGMMKYGTMIWTSDNTWPDARIKIQYGSMMAYPASTMSCHVSRHEVCEDAECHRFRFEVALGGALGYEMHLPKSSEALKGRIREQIATYRKYEDLILRGDYYSLFSPYETNYSAYYYTDEKKEKILVSFLQQKPEEPGKVCLPIEVAQENAVYTDESTGEIYTGEALQKGLQVQSADNDHHSRMWYLVKKM